LVDFKREKREDLEKILELQSCRADRLVGRPLFPDMLRCQAVSAIVERIKIDGRLYPCRGGSPNVCYHVLRFSQLSSASPKQICLLVLVDCDRSIWMNFGAQFVIFYTTILIDTASLKNVRTENLTL